MKKHLEIRASDSGLNGLDFKPYRNAVERRAIQFLPRPSELQLLSVKTPWGETLKAKKGDYIVNELDTPKDKWPVDRQIFEESYLETRPGYYVKRALTYLVPLSDVTGDSEQLITVFTLEGAVTVRSGDFYLARGIKGEIWPYPRHKVETTLKMAE